MNSQQNAVTEIFQGSRTYDRYQRALARLAGLLRGRYLTARQIAAKTHCSRLQAYRRVEALRGTFALTERKVRERPTGPLARAFRIG